MSGRRALSPEEVDLTLQQFAGKYRTRDQALFILGYRTGFRISEKLKLKVKDVFQYGTILDAVTVERRYMKGGKGKDGKAPKAKSRTIPLHAQAQKFLLLWIEEMQQMFGVAFSPEMPLFVSRNLDTNNGGCYRPICRMQAWRIYNHAFEKAQLKGKLGTHSLRKSFGMRMLQVFNGHVRKVQMAMGHSSITSTLAYLEIDLEEIHEGILRAA